MREIILGYQFFSILFLAAVASPLQAQILNPSENSLVWEYTKLYNDRNQEEILANGKLISYPGQKVEWQQNGGDYTDTYQIVDLQGTWNDISKIGSITYNIKWGTSDGTITFSRSGQGLTAELRIINQGRKNSFFKFYIQNAVKL